jgi:hypothetical protein
LWIVLKCQAAGRCGFCYLAPNLTHRILPTVSIVGAAMGFGVYLGGAKLGVVAHVARPLPVDKKLVLDKASSQLYGDLPDPFGGFLQGQLGPVVKVAARGCA